MEFEEHLRSGEGERIERGNWSAWVYYKMIDQNTRLCAPTKMSKRGEKGTRGHALVMTTHPPSSPFESGRHPTGGHFEVWVTKMRRNASPLKIINY